MERYRIATDERTMALHDTEELDDDLGRGADEDLALAAALSVDNVVLRVTVNGRVPTR